jgi:DNA-directed RNA polymerase subunit M/transcription elongation factor TFIIS
MQQTPNVDIKQTTGVTCDECGGAYFDQGLVLRKASGILTGTGKTTYIPIPVFNCRKCGHCNAEFLPKEIEDLG